MNNGKGLVVIKIISIISIIITIVYTLTVFISGNYEDLLISKIQSIIKIEDNKDDKELNKESENIALEDEEYEEDTEYEEEEDIEEEVEEDIEDDGIEEEEESIDTEEYEEIDDESIDTNEGTEAVEEDVIETDNTNIDTGNKDVVSDSKTENTVEVKEEVAYPRIIKNDDGTIALQNSQNAMPINIILDEYINGFWEFNYNYCVIAPIGVEYTMEFNINEDTEVVTGIGSMYSTYNRYINRKAKNNDTLNVKLTAKINGTEESMSFQKTISRGIFGFR